jgi:hypothetical protein
MLTRTCCRRSPQRTIERLRLLAMLQSLFLELAGFPINLGNLLKLGMEICS